MEIKAGDLCIVVGGNLSSGRIVRALRKASSGERYTTRCGRSGRMTEERAGYINWVIEGYVFRASLDGVIREIPIAPESSLRPIRDSGDDVRDVRDVLVPEHLRDGVTA